MPLPSLKPRITRFQPVGSKILTLRHPDAEQIGGIVMPERQFHIGLCRATVIACGPKADYAKPGDTALYPRQNGYHKVDLNGVIHEVVPMESVTAIEPASRK